MPLAAFHPLVQTWFRRRFGVPTEAQRLGWPSILQRQDTLIAAPTGSGKTLAAFLACLDQLIREGFAGTLPQETRVLYVSPLKALSNDIQRNLGNPLKELMELAAVDGVVLPPIQALVRTGDTPASDRQRMIRKPPHILITTPESFYLLLTAESSRRILRTVQTVIVDEIHATARDKRGSHLALSLERLDRLCVKRPVRIGLSATQKPIEELARFLVGTRHIDSAGTSPLNQGDRGDSPSGNPKCLIVDAGHLRELDLAVATPRSPLSAVCSNEQWREVYEQVAEMIQQHRSTLIFVNTRRLAERITHQLSELLGEESVAAHHGSLSKNIRWNVENSLKTGTLKAVVATASLELGIDIGFIDLVIQIGSPRSIATFLQRIGRSGHALGVIPKGRLFALTRDELLECAALIRAVRGGRLDRIEIPRAPLDILAQQIVAAASCEEWDEADLWDWARGAYPYRDLTSRDFEAVLQMLHEGITTGIGRRGAYLYRDGVGHRIKARPGARLVALTSGGAIPELADYRVVVEPEQITVGSVDEDFAVESMAGDVFLLGNTSWRIQHVRSGEVVVADAHGAAPSIPFWRGEAPGRTVELSQELSALRQEIDHRLSDLETANRFLVEEGAVSETAAREAVDYLLAQKAAVGMIPTQDHILIERFFDESGGMQLVIHAPFGSRINRAYGLSLRKRFCRRFDFELQASADDNGIVLSLGPQQSFPLTDIRQMVSVKDAAMLLTQAVLAVPFFRVRWRWNATRSLMVLRQRGGKKVPPPLQRFRADDLLVAVFPAVAACQENLMPGDLPIPDHPLIQQTMHDTLHEAMNIDGFLQLLHRMEEGAIRVTCVDTREPSPFSYQLLNAQPYAFLDDAPLEERRARAVVTRRTLTVESLRDIGRLDPEAIAIVRQEIRPLVRDRDELHDTLLSAGMLPASLLESFDVGTAMGPAGENQRSPSRSWEAWFQELVSQDRALRAVDTEGRVFWVAAERWSMAASVRPGLLFTPPRPSSVGLTRQWTEDEACVAVIRGIMEITGPVTTSRLIQVLGISPSQVHAALAALETEGYILRGHFTSEGPNRLKEPNEYEQEWCVRRLLARIHRLTLDSLRRQMAPVSSEGLFRFLLRWHHRTPGSQVSGREGVLRVIEELQGFEIPAPLWERSIFASRVTDYDPAWLDDLCRSGNVIWGRVRTGTSRSANRALPISLMIREDFDWLQSPETASPPISDGAQKVLESLTLRGALFFRDIVAETGLLPVLVEGALWELAAAGRVSGDGFEGIRSLVSPNKTKVEQVRRRLKRRGQPVIANRLGVGRWWLLKNQTRPSDKRDPLQDRSTEIYEAWARQLLDRYGVFFRDLLARESAAPAWRDLLWVYRRLESRGEIRGGRFITGVAGEQFALPEVVDLLRQVQREKPSEEPILISASDPLNLQGILSPGPKVTASGGNVLAYWKGQCVGHRQGTVFWVDPHVNATMVSKIEGLLRRGNRFIKPIANEQSGYRPARARGDLHEMEYPQKDTTGRNEA